MTNEQILKKAIEKASGNGYYIGHWFMDERESTIDNLMEMLCSPTSPKTVFAILFDHKFAEAFTEFIIEDSHLLLILLGDSIKIEKWQSAGILKVMARDKFLEQMAISKNRLKYLSKFI